MKNSLKALIALSVIALIVLALTFQGNALIQGFTGSGGTTGSGPGGSFVLYYADWCPHCQSVKPDFQKFMGNGTMTINGKTIKIDMVQPEKEPEKAKGVNVKGYPTFIYTDAAGKVVEYSGPRDPDGWLAFLKEKVLA